MTIPIYQAISNLYSTPPLPNFGTLTIGANARIIDEEYAQFSEQEQYFSPYIRTTEDHEFLNQSYGIYTNLSINVTDSTEVTLGNRIQYANITEKWYSQPQVRALQKLRIINVYG